MGPACCIAENRGVFIPGDHGVVIVEAIFVRFAPGHHRFLFLDATVFYHWGPWCLYSWGPWCFAPGDHGVLLLATMVWYS